MEQESLYTIEKLYEIIGRENPATIILLGDITGYDDTILEHSDFYAKFLNLFMYMRKQTKGRLFSVRGNHDFAVKTEWDILEKVCGLKNPKYIDVYKGNVLTTRLHFLNYGEEESQIELLVKKDLTGRNMVSNIVLGHNDYYIEGETTWFKTDKPTHVCNLTNLKGVNTIISGHIHTPLEGMAVTSIGGEEIGLLYPGSPSRAASRDDHEYCYYFKLNHLKNENAIGFDLESIELPPLTEILNPKKENGKTVEDVVEEVRAEEVEKVIRSLSKRRSIRIDVFEQIDSKCYDLFSKESRELAKKTYQEAKNTVSAR